MQSSETQKVATGAPANGHPHEAREAGPQELSLVPLAKLRPSPFNPRGVDLGDLTSLKAAIAEQGLLQALLVRPLDGGSYETVCGHRRAKACELLGHTTVWAVVRGMTDREVVEAQVTENAERLDVHPLDEALALRRLTREHGVTVVEVARRIGRTPQHVYQRLKLADLVPAAAKLFRKGDLTAATALLVARIPSKKLQEEAAAAVAKMSLENAQSIVQRRYMLRLEVAPFDTTSTSYAPAPSCTKCPQRTGNQPELFADAPSKDLCTDTACFKAKADTAWTDIQAKAREQGWTVMDKGDAARAFVEAGATAEGGARYVDLDVKCLDDKRGRTWRQLVGKGEVTVYVARDPDSGAVKYLARTKEAVAAARVEGHALWPEVVEPKDDPKQALRRRTVPAALADIADQATADGYPTRAVARVLVDSLLDGPGVDRPIRAMAARDNIELEKGPLVAQRWLTKNLDSKDASRLDPAAVLVELLLARTAYDVTGGYDKTLTAAAKAAGVDLKKLEAAEAAKGKAAPGAGEKMAKERKKAKARQ